MVTYTILMKPLSVTEPWQDITQAVIEGKDMKIRKGFSSLSSAIDVGNVSLDIHMASLADATLLHVDRKLVQIRMDGVTVFEGVSYDDSSVDLKERSDHVYTKLKFKPYSAFFGDAVAKTDVALIDKKICDPSDTANSLLHILFAMIIENTETPALFSGFNVSTTIVNTKRLPIVLIEADDNLEDHLTKLLYHNGYAYYMDLFTAVVVEPYKDGRSPSTVVKITDVLKSPAINQAPYIDDEKCVVKLGRVDVYDNDTVYELNRDRYEDTGEATEASFIKSGDYYPLDSDDQPSILDASYESERENDNVELIYTEGRSMVYEARQINPNDSSATIPAYIVVAKAELNTLQADIQLYNNLGVDVSLRNIKIMASKAYYRDWSEEYEDKSSKASKVDDYEGIFMPDADTAKAFIQRYVAEKAAERTRINFKTHVVLQPNTLFTITEFPYQLLVRYVTQTEPGFYEYECVAYAITAPNIGSKIKVASKRGALDGSTVIPVTQYALGDENGPIEDAIIVADDTYRVADDYMVLGANSSWSTVVPTPGVGEYIWQRVGYYKPPATRPSSWSDPIRMTGASAKAISLFANPNIIQRTARGTFETNEVVVTATTQNLKGVISWTVSDGDWENVKDEFGEPIANMIVIDSSTVEGDRSIVTATVGEFSAFVAIDVVIIGDDVPVYMGTRDTVPVDMDGEPLIQGDHFLWIGPYIGDDPSHQDEEDIDAEPSEEGEFIFGRMYAWNGVGWEESRNSEHLSHAYIDALKIAKDSGKWIYASVIVAQLGLFQDLLVGNTLKSINYSENESGEPTKGFLLDGPNDVIKAYAMEAYNSKFFGTVESTGFKTITGTDAKNIGVANVDKNLYKYSDMFDLVADNESFVMKGGTVEGFTFDRLTKRNNARILMGSHGYESKTINATSSHLFTKVNPDRFFGNTFRYSISGYYKGNFSHRWLFRLDKDVKFGMSASQNTPFVTEAWMADYNQTVAKFGNGGYSGSGDVTLTDKFNRIAMLHASYAWFGSQGSSIDYLRMHTSRVFNGLVLRNGNSSHLVVEPKPNAYYYKSKTFSIGTDNQNTLSRYFVSGSDFYDLFSALPAQADGYLNTGKIKVKTLGGTLTEHTITRLAKDANGITFYTSGGVVRVNRFVNGTDTGVYEHLEVSEIIAFQDVPDGVEVKSILPWGTLEGNPENVAIGTTKARFNAAYLNTLDVLNNIEADGDVVALGKLIGATINTGDGNYKIGQDLRPTDSPTFATIDTGYGANEVYRMTYESVSMVADNAQTITLSSMPYVGEVKFVYVQVYFNEYVKRLYLPSGGTYFVTGLARNGDSSSWNTILESGSSPYHGPNAGIFSGGTSLFYNESDDTVYVLYIIRRVA